MCQKLDMVFVPNCPLLIKYGVNRTVPDLISGTCYGDLESILTIFLAWAGPIKPGHHTGKKQDYPHTFVQKHADVDAIEDEKQVQDQHTAKNREAIAEGFSAHNGISIEKGAWLYDHNHLQM